jgi:AcrR family transcriptional regulator
VLREEKKQQTRRALIEAALRLFDAQGYDGTTVAEIAGAAGVSPATFFNYFAGKEDVVFADQHLFDEVLESIFETADPEEPVTDFVLRTVRAMADSDVWSFSVHDPLTSIRLRLIGTTPVLRAGFLLRNAIFVDNWARALHRVYAGVLGETDAAALVGGVFGGMVSAAQANIGPDGLPRRPEFEVAMRAAEMIVRGVGPR